MKSLTRDQSAQINAMKISEKHKKFARKIVRYINNKNDALKTDWCIEDPNDPAGKNGVQYNLRFDYESISITDRNHDGDICIDIWMSRQEISYEVSIASKKAYQNHAQFINNELGKLIYGD